MYHSLNIQQWLVTNGLSVMNILLLSIYRLSIYKKTLKLISSWVEISEYIKVTKNQQKNMLILLGRHYLFYWIQIWW